MEPLTAEEQRLVAEAAAYETKTKQIKARWKASGKRLAKLRRKAQHARAKAIWFRKYPDTSWLGFQFWKCDDSWASCLSDAKYEMGKEDGVEYDYDMTVKT